MFPFYIIYSNKCSSIKLILIIENFADVFRTVVEKSLAFDFDSISKMWIGPKLLVFLFNPADVEIILSSHVYIDKSSEYRFFQPWLGDGLLISTGRWYRSSFAHWPKNHPFECVPLIEYPSRTVNICSAGEHIYYIYYCIYIKSVLHRRKTLRP